MSSLPAPAKCHHGKAITTMPIRFIDKPCSGCGTELVHVAPNTKWCDECRRIARRALEKKRRNNPRIRAKRNAAKRDWYQRNIESERQKHREWMAEHKEEQKQKNRDRYYAPGEGGITRGVLKARKWRSDNPEKFALNTKRYIERHGIDRAKESMERYWRNPERARLIQRLRRRIRKGDFLAKIEMEKMTGRILECERLHLRAKVLPCGEKLLCTNCPKNPR